jgi:Calcium binding
MAKKKPPPKPKRDPEREERITMEIIVDCYGPEEQAMGWYYYLEGQLRFPFTAICIAKRAVSPLHVKDEVEVIGMPPEMECEHEMFVTIRWEKDGLAVPLMQLEPIPDTDEQTKEAVADWHYWLQMGYRI